MKYQFFKEDEVKGLMIQFVMLLDAARAKAGIPFIISSGFRTPEANKKAGGAENSAHLRGMAVDLVVNSPADRFKIHEALRDIGFHRIGHYEKHIHVDGDNTLPPNMLWWDKKK